MGYENVKLWFAKDEKENIITIDEVKDIHNTYSCPICGSSLLPKATKSKKITPHFAHIDASKCGGEHYIHWWFKNRLIEPGDEFKVVSDKERLYKCKEILVEYTYPTSFGEYRPDVTVITETGETIYFEMAFSNKKKIKDYLDIWLELNNIVVEVSVKDLIDTNKLPSLKSLFYKGKCFNFNKTDQYYNCIGKHKEKICRDGLSSHTKERLRKLDWFWIEVFNYRKGSRDIGYMADLIDSIDHEDEDVVKEILNKKSCVTLYRNYLEYKNNNSWDKIKSEVLNHYDESYLKYIKKPYIQHQRYFGTNLYLEVYHEDDRCYHITNLKHKGTDEIIRYCLKTLKKNRDYNLIKQKIKLYDEKARIIKEEISRLINEKSLFGNLGRSYFVDYHIANVNMSPSYCSNSFDFNSFKVEISLKYNTHSYVCKEIFSINDTSDIEYKLLNINGIFKDYVANVDSFKYVDFLYELTRKLEKEFELFKLTAKGIQPLENEYEIRVKIQNHFLDNHHVFLPTYYFNNNGVYAKDSYGKTLLSTNVLNCGKAIQNDVKKEIIKTFENECIDCNKKFALSLGEASFFKKKGFTFPKRCQSCREKKKLERYY